MNKMGKPRKYHKDSVYPVDRLDDKDDCQLYSECLTKVATLNKVTKLPCVGCTKYIKVERQLNAWERRQDGYVW
jgi:hypothetical protein